MDSELEFDEVIDQLADELWVCDSVTGNASGSYTFCRQTAKEYVFDNMRLAVESFREFDQLELFAKYIEDENYEYIDVSIRCYLLSQVLWELAEERKAEFERMMKGRK